MGTVVCQQELVVFKCCLKVSFGKKEGQTYLGNIVTLINQQIYKEKSWKQHFTYALLIIHILVCKFLPDKKVSKCRSVQLYTVVRSKVGLYGQNEQHLVTLLGSRGPLLACPALPSELGQCTGAVQCCVLVHCTACAVTRAIYRHSLSIGNKTSAGCLAARCMVQNDLFTSKSSKNLSYIFSKLISFIENMYV